MIGDRRDLPGRSLAAFSQFVLPDSPLCSQGRAEHVSYVEALLMLGEPDQSVEHQQSHDSLTERTPLPQAGDHILVWE